MSRSSEYRQSMSSSSVQPRRMFAQTSVIRANGCVQRTTHPTDNRVCVFQYTPTSQPVEQRWCGVIGASHQQTWNPMTTPWYLNVRCFLHLNNVDNSVLYMTGHCFRLRPIQTPTGGVSHDTVYEFGRHLYVNRDGILCTIEMYKSFRANRPLIPCEEYYINDVLPRVKYSTVSLFEPMRGAIISTLSVVSENAKESESRWWYKYGREERSRVFDWKSIEDLVANGMTSENLVFNPDYYDRLVRNKCKIKTWKPYFGIYVNNRAKLIMRDTITRDGNVNNDDYNHTLIQSGVFIAIQAECRLALMDDTQKLYSLEQLHRNSPQHPIFVLNAVPSMGESNCWGLTIKGCIRPPERNVPMEDQPHEPRFGANPDRSSVSQEVIGEEAILNVPLLGMNCQRLYVYGWDEGVQYVKQCQQQFDYSQFVRSDPNFAFTENFLTSAQFNPNEPLDFPQF